MGKKIYVEDGHIVINTKVGGKYRIALKRCNTYKKIIRWLLHLSEKTWMTVEIMEYFIIVACEANQIDIHR